MVDVITEPESDAKTGFVGKRKRRTHNKQLKAEGTTQCVPKLPNTHNLRAGVYTCGIHFLITRRQSL